MVIKKPNDELEVLRVESGVVSEATLNKCCQDSYVKNYTLHTLPSKLKCAFTLAEVLITLGVIGVVAALTMPTLITNYQKKQTLEKLKSTYSILNNAIEMAKVDYGTNVNEWTVPISEDSTVVADYFCEHYLIPYLKVIKDCNNTENRNCLIEYDFLNGTHIELSSTNRTFMLSNGVIVSAEVFNETEGSGNYRALFLLFLNGKKQTNKMGHDIFKIELGGITNDKNRFLPYYYSPNVPASRYSVFDGWDNNVCAKGYSGQECFAYIMASGWVIPDDYPW